MIYSVEVYEKEGSVGEELQKTLYDIQRIRSHKVLNVYESTKSILEKDYQTFIIICDNNENN